MYLILGVASIKAEVAAAFDVPLAVLESRKRTRTVALARHVAMWLARHTGLSYAVIGQLFGRHHADVIYACRRVEIVLEHDEHYAPRIISLRASLPDLCQTKPQSPSA